MFKQMLTQDIKPQVEGLYVLTKIITSQQQQNLLNKINSCEWNTALKRRTQHYGYEYSYLSKNQATKTQEIPEQMLEIKNRIQKEVGEILKKQILFDQIIINQYTPGQGISPHIDNTTLFDNVVVSLSLGSKAVMIFQKMDENGKLLQNDIILQRRSIVILSGSARYQWKHSIPARKKDDGVSRSTRVSLTFRSMIKKQ